MFRLITVLCLLAVARALSFSDVDKDCINSNKGDVPNDFLLGKWYKAYEFINNALVSSSVCTEMHFSKPTAQELQEYQKKYNTGVYPFTIEENAIVLNEANQWVGLYSGNSEAKFYVLHPTSSMAIYPDGYRVNVFRRINDNYVLFWFCSLRGNNRWLLARDRNASQEEMRQIIASIPDVRDMFARRYCAP